MIDNINFIVNQLEKNLNIYNDILNKEIYLELNKNQIIELTNSSLEVVKNWVNYYYLNDIDSFRKEYKSLEGNLSILELCLSEYEKEFKFNAISYTLYEIGKELKKVK